MNRSGVRARLLPVCLALITMGLAPANQARSPNDGDAPAVDPVPVRTVQVRKVTLQRETTQPGTLHAFYEARVQAKVTGYLKELYVDIGDVVEAGQVLGEIDVPEMMKSRERQEAELAKLEIYEERCRASLEVARFEISAYQARVEQALAEVKTPNAQRAADRSELERLETLVKTGAVTERVRDEARNRYEAAEAACAAAEAGSAYAKGLLKVVQAKSRVAEVDVNIAAARIKVARKELEELDALVAYATLRAPFGGVITERNVDPGELVQNAQNSTRNDKEALFTVAQIDTLRIRVPVPEHDAPWVDVGDLTSFRPRVSNNNGIKGKVTRISKTLDTRTRTMMIEIDLPNARHKLLPGMFGEVTITVDSRPSCLVLPAGAVRHGERGEGSYVYVVGAASKVQHVSVITGLDDGHQIEIVAGLSGNEQVVTGPLARLSPEQRVRVIRE